MAHDISAISPKGWGARVDYDTWTPDPTRIKYAFIHWPGDGKRFTGVSTESEAALRSYENFHLNKEWRGLAYDYSVDLAGRIYRVRGHARSAATSGDMDRDGLPNNRDGDAILCLLGPGQSPSFAMLSALERILGTWKIPPYGHNEAKGIVTACPGPALSSWLRGYRKGNRLDLGTIPPLLPKVDDMAKLSEEAQEFYEQQYKILKEMDVRPSSFGHILSWFRKAITQYKIGGDS